METDLDGPDIAAIEGFGTENGSWSAAAGDVRHWPG